MNAATQTYLSTARAQGYTAAQVAMDLASDPRTAHNIDRKALAGHLLSTGLYERLEAARQTAPVPELRAGLGKLFFTLTSGIDYIGTNESLLVAAEAAGLLGGLVARQVLTEDEAGQVFALGGGPYYTPLTAEQITAHWAAEEAREAEQQLRERCAAGYNQVVEAVDAGETEPAALAALFTTALEG